MVSPRADDELIAVLEDVGVHLADPPHHDLVAVVQARLAAHPRRGRSPRRSRRLGSRAPRFAVPAVALVITVGMILTFSPGTRHALADWLGLRGVRVEQTSHPLPTGLGGRLDLGAPATLDEVDDELAFDALLPPTTRFGSPDEVYVAESPHGDRVTFLYQPRDGLPPAAASAVGMLVTEFRADLRVEQIYKSVGGETQVDVVTVGGGAGYWFAGGPHVVSFADADGRFFDDQTRLAGNTLLWERGNLTLRLETGLSKDEAISLAESMK